MNLFKTRFGAFSADGKEFVVTSPRTPRPWINVISNGDYGLTLSQTGSGYSWRTHAQVNRITRWEQDLVKDDWGKYIYLKDDQGHTWSAGWKPVCATPQSYRCRHGAGYSIIESLYFDIETELTVFVPVDEPLEVWKLTIRNRARKKRRIDVMTYLEWGLGRAPDWHREFHKTFIQTSYDPKLRAILANKSLWEIPTDKGHWNTDWPYTAFHSASVKPLSFETSKEAFLGMYGSVSNPAAVQKGRGGKNAGRGLDAVASLHIRLSLKPHESTVVVFTVGAADSSSQAGELVSRFHDEASADDALKSVVHRWENLLGATSVQTPDDAMNLMQNTWLKYQTISGRLWGRTAYYQTGGAYGFRDQLQDSQIWLPIEPSRTLSQIRLNARHQFKDGSVYHWWHPITEDGLHNKISDNLLWLPYVMANYLLEIGNDDGLDVEEPWVDDENASSLLEHCTRAIDLALQRLSPRGLPLIGAGDWNDGLSAVGLDMRGESIWLGQFLHKILGDFGTILERCGNSVKSAEYIAAAERLKQSINEFGWDGSWYWGATKDSGEKLGSKENQQGTIWLNPQIWGILGGVADAERANLIMDVVEQKLETAIGPLLLSPAYQTSDRNIGYLTRYGPGMRENGGVYTHAATWAVIAAAQLGRGKTAFRIYSKLNPIMRGKDPLTYSAEPYVTAGNIDGPDSSFFGRGGWTWYSGSAAWLFRAGLDWILGVRPTWEGLAIDPCIPPDWKEFSVCRRFRGTVYNIHVSNPDGVESGVSELRIDGRVECRGSGPRNKVIKPIKSDSVVEIEVVMGKNTGQ